MKNRTSFFAMLALLLALTSTNALAEAWYQIDVIVFQRNGGDSAEFWPQDPGYPDLGGAIPVGTQQRGQASLPDGTVAYQSLPEGSLQLTDAYKKLQASGRYEPLIYQGWKQPVGDKNSAARVLLRSGERLNLGAGDNPNRVVGTLRLSMSRYLHLELDLVLNERAQSSLRSNYSATGSTVVSQSPVQAFRLKEHRRMRSGEVHYIDHPKFGVLIHATPASPGQAGATGAATEGESAPPVAEPN